jgi:hypothetical protein
MQSAPLLLGEHTCTQEINNGLMKSSNCKETHLFRPFSDKSSGAQTTVSQKFTYRDTRPGINSRKGRLR